MKELADQIQTVFGGMVTSGELNKIIEEKIRKAVESVLGSCFRDYSPFQKALEEHINQTLRVNFDDLGLAGYNDTILKIIKTQIDANVHRFAEKQITEGLAKLLQSPPETITLSALLKAFKDFCAEERRYNDEEDRLQVAHELKRDDISTGYGVLKLKSQWRRDGHGEKQFELAFNASGEVYRISLPYQGDITKRLFAGPFYGFEKLLFQMYAAKTRLLLDEVPAED